LLSPSQKSMLFKHVPIISLIQGVAHSPKEEFAGSMADRQKGGYLLEEMFAAPGLELLLILGKVSSLLS